MHYNFKYHVQQCRRDTHVSNSAYTNMGMEVGVGLGEQGPLVKYSITLSTFLLGELVMVAIILGFFEISFLED
jgi:hypothetical protein